MPLKELAFSKNVFSNWQKRSNDKVNFDTKFCESEFERSDARSSPVAPNGLHGV